MMEKLMSLSGLALYRKEIRNGPSHKCFRVASDKVEVPLQSLPDLVTAKAKVVEAGAYLRDLQRAGAPMTKVYPAQLVERWAQGVLEKVACGIERESLSFDITGFRLDDFALMCMPGEPFVEIGLAVKAASQARHTMFAGYCNGSLAYWPTGGWRCLRRCRRIIFRRHRWPRRRILLSGVLLGCCENWAFDIA